MGRGGTLEESKEKGIMAVTGPLLCHIKLLLNFASKVSAL
jgi:hypothetical protein